MLCDEHTFPVCVCVLFILYFKRILIHYILSVLVRKVSILNLYNLGLIFVFFLTNEKEKELWLKLCFRTEVK